MLFLWPAHLPGYPQCFFPSLSTPAASWKQYSLSCFCNFCKIRFFVFLSIFKVAFIKPSDLTIKIILKLKSISKKIIYFFIFHCAHMISCIIGLHSEPLTLSTLHPFSLWHFSICRPQSTVHILSSLKVSHVQYFALQIKGRCWIWINPHPCIINMLYTVQTNIRLWQNLGDVPGLKFSETLPYQSKFLTWLVEIQNAPALLIASESLIPAQTPSAKEENFVTHLGIWKGVNK